MLYVWDCNNLKRGLLSSNCFVCGNQCWSSLLLPLLRSAASWAQCFFWVFRDLGVRVPKFQRGAEFKQMHGLYRGCAKPKEKGIERAREGESKERELIPLPMWFQEWSCMQCGAPTDCDEPFPMQIASLKGVCRTTRTSHHPEWDASLSRRHLQDSQHEGSIVQKDANIGATHLAGA